MIEATHAVVTHSPVARLNRIRHEGTESSCEAYLTKAMDAIKSDSLRRAIVPVKQAREMMKLNEMTLVQAGQHPELYL